MEAEKLTTSCMLSPAIKEKLKDTAQEREVTVTSLLEEGALIMAYLPERAWETMKFNEERCSRHLSPGQQIVDALSVKFNAPRVKWGREG